MKLVAFGLFCLAASLVLPAQANAAGALSAAPLKSAKSEASIHRAPVAFADNAQSGSEATCPVLMQTRAHRIVLIRRTNCELLIQA